VGGPIETAPSADIPVVEKAPSPEIIVTRKGGNENRPRRGSSPQQSELLIDEGDEEQALGCSTTGNMNGSTLSLFALLMGLMRLRTRRAKKIS
jgi:uncharacterized protein (TIGR03382 family)